MHAFDRVVADIVGRVAPADPLDLQGFEIDVEHYLSQQTLFADVATRRITAESRVEAEVECLPGEAELADVWPALGAAWASIGYTDFAATRTEWNDEMLTFHFVTMPGDEVYFVRGTICVRGPWIVPEFDATPRRVRKARGFFRRKPKPR